MRCGKTGRGTAARWSTSGYLKGYGRKSGDRRTLPPVEEGRVRPGFREHGDRAQAVREIRITRQVVSRGSPVGGFCSSHVGYECDSAGLHQVIEYVIAGVIHIGIDLVRGQVPGFEREPYADVPTDLADPDRLALEPEGCHPQPQVEPFVDRLPRLLQREVLAASIHVQRTH